MSFRSQGLITTVLIGAAFLAGIDLFIVNVAFDEIGRDLAGPSGADLAELSWVLNAYAVLYAALLVPLGRLTDRYGRKPGFVAGLVLFTAASAACALAGSIEALIAFRAIQAVGAAAMTPASLGLLLAALPAERRAPAARLFALTGALAAAFGPAVGGGLVQLSWHWAFWINVPLGVALALAAIRLVPDVRHNTDAPRPDLGGAVLVAVAVGALVLGLVEGEDWGWASGGVLGAWAVAVLAAALFAWRTATHPSPVVDPALLRVRAFAGANLATLLFNTGFGASLLAGILWMQQVWGYSALRTGLAVALGPLVVPVSSLVAHRLFPRAAPAGFIVAGTLTTAAGAVLMAASLSPDPSYLTTVLPAWVVTGIGVGLVMPNLVAAATADLPPEQASTGSGVITMARQLGLVLGVSVLVAVVGADPTEDGFRTAWLLVAASGVAAAVAATATLAVRRPSGSLAPQPAGSRPGSS